MSPSVEFVLAFEAMRGPRCYTAAEFVESFNARTAPGPNGCIEWTGAGGLYGRASVAGRSMGAHRVAYWMATGVEPPADMQIDHLCRNTRCVKPSHLELVTPRVNNLRAFGWSGVNASKTHCIHGHEFTPENTRITKRGRDCRRCNLARFHAQKHRRGRKSSRIAALAETDQP